MKMRELRRYKSGRVLFCFVFFVRCSKRWQGEAHLSESTYLFMEVLVGEQVELLAVNFLLVEHILVVHLLEEARVFDAIGLEELQVRHLERLTDGLSNELGLKVKKKIVKKNELHIMGTKRNTIFVHLLTISFTTCFQKPRPA